MGGDIVGPRTYGDGNPADNRFGYQGEHIVGFAHGTYWEASRRGVLFVATTAAAGVAPGTGQSTTPPFALWNPPNSGYKLSIMKAYVGYVSGTIGAGTLEWATVTSQTTLPTTGTELTVQATLLNATKGIGRAFQGSTLSATPTVVRPGFVLSAQAAATAAPIAAAAIDMVDGELIVPAGACATLQGITAAGTAPLILIGVVWEEVKD